MESNKSPLQEHSWVTISFAIGDCTVIAHRKMAKKRKEWTNKRMNKQMDAKKNSHNVVLYNRKWINKQNHCTHFAALIFDHHKRCWATLQCLPNKSTTALLFMFHMRCENKWESFKMSKLFTITILNISYQRNFKVVLVYFLKNPQQNMQSVRSELPLFKFFRIF